jgi:cystathionine beta-lyase/cystathionine gamma-synthase
LRADFYQKKIEWSITMTDNSYRIETQAIHAGQEPDPVTGAVIPPIYQTSTFKQLKVGQNQGYFYSRKDNPTRAMLETNLAALEQARFALAYPSGMAAIDAVLRFLRAGDHLLINDDVYGGTFRLVSKVLLPAGIAVSFVDMTDREAFKQALRPTSKLVWLETPTNPSLKIIDIAGLAGMARAHGLSVVVDNTFASPYLQQPLPLGADIVVHSATKYLGGHSDVISGALMLNDPERYEHLKFMQYSTGAVPGPQDCWLLQRGIKTLAVRLDRHCQNALGLAQWLSDHPAIDRVHYPGLPDHPQHELAKRQMRDFGGMVSFVLKGGPAAALEVAARTRLFTLAVSLGGVESLIEVPAAMTHLATAGSAYAPDPALVRLSVGLEHIDDLKADLAQALAAV